MGRALRARHPESPDLLGGNDFTPDFKFRDTMAVLAAARPMPDAWIEEAFAFGRASDCVKKVQEFKEAGADEIATYVSAPAQYQRDLCVANPRRGAKAVQS